MNNTGMTIKADLNALETSLSPVRLSYVAALRGIAPRDPTSSFNYAQLGCTNIEAFLALAASNPEGHFSAVVTDAGFADRAQKQAAFRSVTNVAFLTGTAPLCELDYLVCDERQSSVSKQDLAALAAKALRVGGLLAYHYSAYPNADESLRFIVNEFSPEMNVSQASTFLGELKALGTSYFENHPISAAALERSMAQNVPDQFFATCDTGVKALSGTFETMVAMGPCGMTYVGDVDIQKNYMDLATPAASHDVLVQCQDNLMYEPIKDFVMQRLDRCDIWCRAPVAQTDDLVVLYNSFTFGITLDRAKIPDVVSVGAREIDLTVAPYPALMDLMSFMPVRIGDFLHHETGAGVAPADVIMAVNVLVAIGVASPMRSSYSGQDQAVLTFPKWATGFNKYWNEAPVISDDVLLASPVFGNTVVVSARDALVLQAISRAGMKDSVSALLPELMRVANDPALAARVMDVAEPTPEAAYNMITEVVGRSMIQWYTYGLLAA